MATIKIDNREIVVEAGSRLIEVARENGIEIPSLCYDGKLPHYSSCLVCMVKDLKTNKYIPSCSVTVEDGMIIDCSGDEVVRLRREALSMLLSEHRAECEAPCRLVCPVGLDIPKLNRLIADGEIEQAGELAYQEMGLPASICQICPAYCENACRRKMIDHKIAIATLVGNSSAEFKSDRVSKGEKKGKKVAIIGGGATGLIAAHFLSLDGHQCEIFEISALPGGSIVAELKSREMPLSNTEKEIERLLASGIIINYNVTVNNKYISDILIDKFDAAVITTSEIDGFKDAEISPSYLLTKGDSIILNGKYIFLLNTKGTEKQQIVRSVGIAKKAALGISSFLDTGEISIPEKRFNSVIGKIEDLEKTEWLKECADNHERYELPSDKKESLAEASNCLHCDCRASTDCRLRDLCNELNIKNPAGKSTGFPIEKKMENSSGIIFEHAKCIKCGLCVRVMDNGTNDPSLCFTGRGFITIISEPVTYGFDDFSTKEIDKAIDICPTGALTRRER
jgi:ferredoxin